MSRYYAGSKPFEWLRKKLKVEKPYALPFGAWDQWSNDFKKARPVAFFLTETLPDVVEWIPNHSIEYLGEVRIYFSNYFGNTHGLQSTLQRGKWHEFDKRILHSCFDSYIDFIECEEASGHVGWNKEEDKKYRLSWKDKHWFTRGGKRWRCAQAGVDHLLWEMSLVEGAEMSHQAESAVEKLILYTWWKNVRPARKESWAATGFQQFWDQMKEKYGDDDWLGLGGKGQMSATEQQQYDLLSSKNDELEHQREAEDTEMLIRLIKIRGSLWT